MFKKLSLVLLVGALLTGCAGTTGQSAGEVFVDDIQTSFEVELAKSPTITEEEGEYYISPSAVFDVYDEVVENNIVDGVITGSLKNLEHRGIGNELRITGEYVPIRNPTKITMWLEINDKTSEATLVYLEVDGEEAVIK